MASAKNTARARAGAAWLDEKIGPGWRRIIRRRRLRMEVGGYEPDNPDSCGCVLSQIDSAYRSGGWGSYTRAARDLGLRAPVGLGFIAGADSAGYDDLDEAWREVLRERPAS